MVATSLIATVEAGRTEVDTSDDVEESWSEADDMGGEEAQYLNGESRGLIERGIALI